jgi:hypothetical protein
MKITKKFEKANVIPHKGGIKIDSVNTTMENKHYNVSVTIDTELNTCTVFAEKPKYGINFYGALETLPDINDVMDSSIETYKLFPWSTPSKRIRKGWFELKERNKISYISNNYVIVE